MSEYMPTNKSTEDSGNSYPEHEYENPYTAGEKESGKSRLKGIKKNIGRAALVFVFAGAIADRQGYFQMGYGNFSPYHEEVGLTPKGQEAVNDLFRIEEDSTAGKIVESLTVQNPSYVSIGEMVKNLTSQSSEYTPGEIDAAEAKDIQDFFLNGETYKFAASEDSPSSADKDSSS